MKKNTKKVDIIIIAVILLIIAAVILAVMFKPEEKASRSMHRSVLWDRQSRTDHYLTMPKKR